MPEILSPSPFVFQKRNSYYFRFHFPRQISILVGKSELRYSLRTGHRQAAIRRAMSLVAGVERFIWQLRKDLAMHQLSQQHLQALLQQHLHSILDQYEEQRILARKPLSATDVENEKVTWDYLARDTQEQLARNDYSRVKLNVDDLLEENNIQLDPESIEYRRACREYLKIEARLVQTEQQRCQGIYDAAQAGAIPVVTETVLAPSLPGAIAAPHSLSTLIQAYLNEHRGQCWTDKTDAEYTAILSLFMSVVGDLPLVALNAQTILQFRNVVSKLPANMNKMKQFKGKSIEQILSMPDVTPMSRVNANKYITRVSQLLKWAHDLDYIKKNYAENKTLPTERRPDQQRDAFTDQDLRTIFHCAEYQHPQFKGRDREASHYWLPLLGLFTGARIEELCQLHLADIRQQDGVWILDITDEILAEQIRSGQTSTPPQGPEKKLKTDNAKRIVPLHRQLLELGFIDFVNNQRTRGATRLFPELIKQRDGYSQVSSKWFGRFLDRQGITDRKKVFHSLRHTLINHMKQNLVPAEIIREIVGHDRGDDITLGRYGKAYKSEVLKEFIDSIDFALDLSLIAGKWQELSSCKSHGRNHHAGAPGNTTNHFEIR